METMSPRVVWGLSGQGEPGGMGPPTFQACSGCMVSRLPAPVSSCQGMDPVVGLSRQCQKSPCGGTGSVVLEHPCARMGMGSGPKAPGLGVKQVFGDTLCQQLWKWLDHEESSSASGLCGAREVLGGGP